EREEGIAPDRRAPARVELESPVVQRTDRLTILDPAKPHRTVRVRAAAEHGIIPAAVIEDGDRQAFDLDRYPTALLDIRFVAHSYEPVHATTPTRVFEINKTKNLGLASGANP